MPSLKPSYLVYYLVSLGLWWWAFRSVALAAVFGTVFCIACLATWECSDYIGDRTGWTVRGYISKPTPGGVIRGFVWVAMVLVVVFLALIGWKR